MSDLSLLLAAETGALTAIARLIAEAELPAGGATARQLVLAHLRRLARRLRPTNQSPPPANPLPVHRYLDEALVAAEAGLMAGLWPLLPWLIWVQNPNYRAEVMPAGFLANYGYAELVGQRGLISDNEFALGLLLLGPCTEYPPHHHPAEEFYYTVSGATAWWQAGQPWIERPPGQWVYHASGASHAMRTMARPALLLYCWWGETRTAARLTPDSPVVKT